MTALEVTQSAGREREIFNDTLNTLNSLEDDVLYVCEDDAHALQEDVEDVGVDLDRLVAVPATLQRETQVNLKQQHRCEIKTSTVVIF